MKKNTYKKYFNATLAAAVAVSGASVIAPTETKASTSFPDVSTNNMFYKDIINLAERGIIKGYPDGKFHPGDNVTRGQAAIIISGVLGLDTVNVSKPNFDDVSSSSYYYAAVAAMVKEKIINGYGDGTFKPDAPITRTEMAIMLTKAFNLTATPGFKTPFKDVEGSKYEEYINALYENGITVGVSKTQFDGNSNVSRGQLAAFVVRAENLEVEVEEKEVSIKVSEISEQLKSADGSLYNIASNLQGLLNESNSAALQNAKLQVVVKDDVIISIEAIELNTDGSKGAFVTLDGQGTTFTGTLTVNADYVQVKNLTVDGDVILTNRAVNEFDADGLNINGELIIQGAEPVAVASLNAMLANTTTGPKINLPNTTINKISAQRDHVAIELN